MARLEAEHDNLRAALGWAAELPAFETGLRLAVALYKFWERRGYFREAQQWLERLLAAVPGADLSPGSLRLRAQALNVYAQVLEGLTDYFAAEATAAQALAAWRELEEASGMADSLAMLGAIAVMHNEYERAVQLLQEARTQAYRAGNKQVTARVMNSLGRIALASGNWDEAESAFFESRALYHLANDRIKAAYAWNNLGLVARYRGDLTLARDLLKQTLSEQRALGARPGTAISLLNLATVERLDRHPAEALAALRQAAALALEIDDRRVQAWCIKEFGHLLCAEGDWAQGIGLLAASENARQALGISFRPADPADLSRDTSLGRTAPGEAAFESVWRSGSRWSLSEAYSQVIAGTVQIAPGEYTI